MLDEYGVRNGLRLEIGGIRVIIVIGVRIWGGLQLDLGLKGGIEGELVLEMRVGVKVGDEVRVSRIAAEVYICYQCEGRGQIEMIFGSQLVLEVTGKWWEIVFFFLY